MKTYTCGYRHCLHTGEKVTEDEAVMVGGKRMHSDCARTHATIERAKQIYYRINPNHDYRQIMGVFNNLVFKKEYPADYVEFMMMYIAMECPNVLKSPYTLHYMIKNNLIDRKYKNPTQRQELIRRYACRYE